MRYLSKQTQELGQWRHCALYSEFNVTNLSLHLFNVKYEPYTIIDSNKILMHYVHAYTYVLFETIWYALYCFVFSYKITNEFKRYIFCAKM